MRKLLLLGVWACLCLLPACEKDNPLMSAVTADLPSVEDYQPNATNGLQVIQGVLILDDGDQFNDLLSMLEEADDSWQADFLTQVSGLEEAELDNLNSQQLDQLAQLLEEEEVRRGITEDLIYESFEMNMGIQSLRAKLTDMENDFLNSPDPDWSMNPDDHYIVGTAERSLINEKGEIGVDGKLYKFMHNGVIYEVEDGDFATLAQIKPRHAVQPFQADNVNIYNYGPTQLAGQNCRTWVRDRLWVEYEPGKRKYKGKVGHRSLVFTNHVFSKVTHYKKKRRKWKKRRAWIATKAWGKHGTPDPGNLNANCNHKLKFDTATKNKFRRKVSVRHTTMGVGFGKVESGDVHCFWFAQGHLTNFTLQF